MPADTIATEHPDPNKQGARVDRAKYQQIRGALEQLFEACDDSLTFSSLTPSVSELLPDFDGSVGWYVTTIKLDLEARGLIERVPKARPQRLRWVG